MNYLDVQQTLDLLNKDLPPNQVRYGLTQLADLCRRGREHLTPLFYYDKCLDLLERGYDPEHDDQPIKPSTFSGYLSADSLQSLVNKTTSPPVTLYSAIVYETYKADYVELTKGDRVALCSTAHDGNPQNTISTYDLKAHDAATVTHDDLRFSYDELNSYIFKHYITDLTTPEQQHIAKLESDLKQINADNAKLESQLAQAHADNAKLRQQNSTPANDDKELPHNSQAAVTRLLNVLFHMGGHDDLSAHSGTLNQQLVNYSRQERLGGASITKNFVSDWIQRVEQLRIDTEVK
jgi:hypothetical protein